MLAATGQAWSKFHAKSDVKDASLAALQLALGSTGVTAY